MVMGLGLQREKCLQTRSWLVSLILGLQLLQECHLDLIFEDSDERELLLAHYGFVA